eukprot:3825593-Karenia_brevis.AAC.1
MRGSPWRECGALPFAGQASGALFAHPGRRRARYLAPQDAGFLFGEAANPGPAASAQEAVD